MRTSCLVAFAAIFTVTSHAQASPKPEPSSDLRQLISHKAPELLKQYDVPSVAIGYIENDELAWTAVYGEQSPGVPANEKTLYNIASLTKPISAEILLRLVAEGKVSLDEPVSAYWVDPDVKDDPRNKLLTPRLCLSHQTGFPNWRSQTDNVLKFQWEPGTRMGYSGEGYQYVARFAEKKTGKSFPDLAQEYVFNPIGMKDTSYVPRDWFAGRLAVPRGPKGETEPKVQSTWNAADLVRTTIGDYGKFVVSVMHNQKLTKHLAQERLTMTRNIATPDQVKEICTAQKQDLANCNVSAGMGLGWQVIRHNGETIVDHSGADWGVHTAAFFIPQKHLGVVIFTNGDNGPKVIQEIAKIFYPDSVFAATL